MTKTLRLTVMLTAALWTAVPAFAQLTQPPLRQGRPARGLFGGGVGETGQQLILTGSLGGGYDKDQGGSIFFTPENPSGAAVDWSGQYATGTTQLSYSLNRSSFSAGASASASARYKPNATNFSVVQSYGATGHVSGQLSSRTSISATQAISRQPHNIGMLYGTGLDPFSVPSDPTYDLSGATGFRSYLNTTSSVGLNHLMTSRISLNAGYGYHNQAAYAGDPLRGSRTHNAGAGVSYAIWKSARVRVGYRYTSSRYGTAAPVVYKGLSADAGVDFGKAISLSRRATAQFSTGISGAKDAATRTHYFLTGNVGLTYELGRSWTAGVNYRRGVDFDQGLGQPVLVDTASGGVGGDIGRRLQMRIGWGWATGGYVFATGGNGYSTTTGNTTLRWAMSRNLGLAATYAYRRYRFSQQSPVGLVPYSQRHTVRITLDAWLPLMIRSRRPNAAG